MGWPGDWADYEQAPPAPGDHRGAGLDGQKVATGLVVDFENSEAWLLGLEYWSEVEDVAVTMSSLQVEVKRHLAGDLVAWHHCYCLFHSSDSDA